MKLFNFKTITLFFFIQFFLSSIYAQVQDGIIDDPGDIAFVAFHDNDDGFSFLFLDDCPAGTEIRFTDEGWNGSAFNSTTAEGEVLWINDTGNTIAAGIVIDITDADDNTAGIQASLGTATEDDLGFTTGVSNEQIYAITGTRAMPGIFLAFVGDTDDGATPASLAGTGLVAGSTALIILDNEGYYTGSLNCNGTIGECSTMINDINNWTLGSFNFPTDVPNTFAGSVFSSNTAPTATSFTASPGPVENAVYTFATANFGYNDTDSDPLNNLLIEIVPTAGTLYVDANNSDTFDGGEELTNGSTVSLANLNAGNLQYIQNGSTNTSFQFEVNDGTENSTGNYVATLNVTALSSITVNDPTVSEGDAGTATLQYTVSLDQAASGTITVDVATSNGTATAGSDYTALGTTTVTFNAGETNKTVDVTVSGDTTLEVDETINLNLTNATGTSTITDATGVGTITNDDSATVTIADVSVNENDGTATITLTLDNAVDGGFDVDLSTADGTATTADGDYTAVTSATETFAGTASETQTFTITLGGDTKVEADETVSISMSGLSPATVASGDIDITDGATLTINNDDQATVTIADVSGNENDGAITVTVTL
ncbi:Calx-beta domain-containing protein, partial [Aquimarina amphilecti]